MHGWLIRFSFGRLPAFGPLIEWVKRVPDTCRSLPLTHVGDTVDRYMFCGRLWLYPMEIVCLREPLGQHSMGR